MKQKLFFFFILYCNTLSFAQTDIVPFSHFMKDTTQGYSIRISGNYFFTSDAITNGFATDYFNGKILTDDMKDGVSENLSAKNIFAAEANWEASLTFHPDTNNRKVEAIVGYRSRSHSDARFPEDFFNLFFRGNKMFGGKTADLTDFFFQQYSYRQVFFGIGNEFTLSKNKKIYAGTEIAINQGIKFLKVDVGNTKLYTDPGGEFIDADLHASIYTDDSAAQHPSRLDGTGYSANLYFEYETERSLISISAENFGNIHWNKWSTKVSIDSLFHFDGIDVRDIFEIGDSIQVKDISLDSTYYMNFIRNKSEQRITTKLPMKISGSYTYFTAGHKISTTIGVDLLLNTYSSIRYILGVGYKFNRSNFVGITLVKGGYTDFHAGINYVHLFPWRMKLELGSNYIYPMITYKTGKSQGAYLSLSKSF